MTDIEEITFPRNPFFGVCKDNILAIKNLESLGLYIFLMAIKDDGIYEEQGIDAAKRRFNLNKKKLRELIKIANDYFNGEA